MKSFVPFLFRVFVPEFSSRLDVFIVNCSVKLGNDCELSVTVGSSTLRQGSEVKQNCSGLEKLLHIGPHSPVEQLVAGYGWD